MAQRTSKNRESKPAPKAPIEATASPPAEDSDREDPESDSPDAELVEAVPEVIDDVSLADDAEDSSDDAAAISRYDPMQAYLQEVQRHPLLSHEEEQALATDYFATGNVRAAHRLVTANLRLVVKIAYEYRRAYKNIMDLVQEGNVGLMQAVKKFDPTRGVKLSSYAAFWIRAYILRYILNNWRMVKIGTTQAQRKLFFNLNKEKQRLLAMGIEPTPEVLADRLAVEQKEVVEMEIRLGSSEASLDAPVAEGEGRSSPRVDFIDGGTEPVDVMLAEAEMTQNLREKLKTFRTTLRGKELDIFEKRLASTDEPLTLQELGDRFGVSRERVRQLEARLLSKLRKHLGEDDAQDSESAHD